MAHEVFISYSHQDQLLRQKLDNHLSNLKRQNIITSWHDGEITAGTNWRPQIMQHLNNAQIILLLISDDFMASDFCYSNEMIQAIARHDANQARVIPIILRPVDWQGEPFEKIQALPTGGKPVTNWSNQDSAFLDIVRGIRKAIDDLTFKSAPAYQERPRNIPYARNHLFTSHENVRLHNEPVDQLSDLPDMPSLQTLSSQGSVTYNPSEYQIQVNLSKGAKIDRTENADAKTNSTETRIQEERAKLETLQLEDTNAYIQECKGWVEKAKEARKYGRWEVESDCWEILRYCKPYIAQARARRKIVKENQDHKNIYDDARQSAEKRDKDGTKKKLLELWQKAPFYGDPDGLAWGARLYIPLGGWRRKVWMSFFWSGFVSLVVLITALILAGSNIQNSQYFANLSGILAILTGIIFSAFFYLNYRWIYLNFAFIITPTSTTTKPGVNSSRTNPPQNKPKSR